MALHLVLGVGDGHVGGLPASLRCDEGSRCAAGGRRHLTTTAEVLRASGNLLWGRAS